MKIARSLQKYINAKRAAKDEEMRSKIFETYVPVIMREAALLAGKDVPEYDQILAKVTRRPKILDEIDIDLGELTDDDIVGEKDDE
jgi:DNA topoisomerase-6 subunit B